MEKYGKLAKFQESGLKLRRSWPHEKIIGSSA
jgi:hypothetical protein